MYITYRAREKLRAFTCTGGAREVQLAARDGHQCMNVHVSDAYMSYMGTRVDLKGRDVL